jgi:hypothetical protein
LIVAGERPSRSAIWAIDSPSHSRKWRARATARRRSTTRSYLSAETLDRNAFQILLDSAFAPDAALQRLIETAAKAWRPSSEAGTPAKAPLAKRYRRCLHLANCRYARHPDERPAPVGRGIWLAGQ